MLFQIPSVFQQYFMRILLLYVVWCLISNAMPIDDFLNESCNLLYFCKFSMQLIKHMQSPY